MIKSDLLKFDSKVPLFENGGFNSKEQAKFLDAHTTQPREMTVATQR